MTVTSQISRNDYNGNGVTTQFPVTFRFLQNSQIKVIRTIVATGVATTLTLDAAGADGYSVTGANLPSGGQVTLNVALPLGSRLSILRNVPVTQEIDYLPNDPFPAESHELGLDKLTMAIQQQSEISSRSITLPPQTVGVSTELPSPVPFNLIGWNPSGTAIINIQPPEIATVANGAVTDDSVASDAGINSTKLTYVSDEFGGTQRLVSSKLADIRSVKDHSSPTYPASASAAFQAAANLGGATRIPDGQYSISGITAGANYSYWDAGYSRDGAGLPLNLPGTQELWFNTSRMFYQARGGAYDDGVLRVQRDANYVGGGVNGYENCAAKMLLTTGASSASYESTLLTILDNNANTAAQNVAQHVQSHKRGTGSTWNFANECTDWTGNADPASGLIGIEQVMAANGTDANTNRVGLDIIASRPQESLVYTGATAEIGYGIRLTNQVADSALNKFVYGVFLKGYYRVSVIDTTQAVIDSGGAAVRMANGQLLSFTVNGDRTLRYDVAALRYRVGGSDVVTISDAGAVGFGAGVGEWSTFSTNTAILSTAGTQRLVVEPGAIRPASDNSTTSGNGANRWSVVYAATGTINTSDAREKTTVSVMTSDEIEAAKALSKEIGTYQWLASIKEKGDAARKHVGLTVQRAIEVMESHGLDPMAYGFICHDVLEDGDIYGFRYDQLNMFIARGFEARLSALEPK